MHETMSIPLLCLRTLDSKDLLFLWSQDLRWFQGVLYKRDILKIYELEKEMIFELLTSNTSRVTIITDMWTSNIQKTASYENNS